LLELNRIYNMDCLDGMKLLDDNSVDSIVTDPPYELGFMGKKWDSTGIAYNVDVWRECLRVLKPGGHLLAFGGTRTYHRMACAIEDAGFEIRDQMQWIYGSGFPKSHDISKAIDKKLGAERKIVEKRKFGGRSGDSPTAGASNGGVQGGFNLKDNRDITSPATPEAQEWEGWGTALKPANEPIVLARKPISEKTIADNVLKWGTGGINIDGCRLNTLPRKTGTKPTSDEPTGTGNTLVGSSKNRQAEYDMLNEGRFPANVILDEEAGRMLDEQQEGASRFFYCAKPSKKERNMGLEGVEPTTVDDGRNKPIDNPFLRGKTLRQNTHPTVKPVKLMEYLITLVTPPNGIVLDPFMGSGTTAVACIKTNRKYIGFEISEEYCKIAEKRISETTSNQIELPEIEHNVPQRQFDWLDELLEGE